MKYIKGLDSVRAVAILLVLCWHMLPRHEYHTLAGVLEQFLLPTGVFGVNLFFVLSGFLITRILLQVREQSNSKWFSLKIFIVRRALRIFPIYYLFLLALLAIHYRFEPGMLPHLFVYTTNFYLVHLGKWVGMGYTWSLSAEEQFYLIWPFVILFVNKKFLPAAIAIFISIALIAAVILRETLFFNSVQSVCLPLCFDAFGLGGMYAYATQKHVPKLTRRINAAFLFALSLSFYWKVGPYAGYVPTLQFFTRTVHSLLALWIVHHALNPQSHWVKRHILENRILTAIGRVSYGVYIFHWCLPHYIAKSLDFFGFGFLLEDDLSKFIVLATATIGVAFLSFHFIEHPIITLKDRLFPYKTKVIVITAKSSQSEMMT